MTDFNWVKALEPVALLSRFPRLAGGAAALVSVAGLLIFCPSGAAGQTGGPYDLSWSKFTAGGTPMTAGGAYALATAGGQPDATPDGAILTGGTYSLSGGFLQTADMFPLPVGLSEFSLE